MNNPYNLPNKPRVTIRQILIWAVAEREITLEELAGEFRISLSDAGVRLLKLYRWGYLRRRKSRTPPKVFRYTPTKYGRKASRRWKKEA